MTIKTINASSENWQVDLQRPQLEQADLTQTINNIFSEVKKRGDKALIDFTQKFDGIRLKTLVENTSDLEGKISVALANAIETAAQNISTFHSAQLEDMDWITTTEGISCTRRSVPIQTVGLYIPGGSAPLLSTVLMLAIPAQLAGCKKIILTTPPNTEGKIDPAIIAAAKKCGIEKIYKIGGAQAIAAMTYGTETIPKVNKIFGPGNQYVTAAKAFAQTQGVAIDMPAGPSEVLVIADAKANADFIAADLLAQAEHGPDSQVVLVSWASELFPKVLDALDKQIQVLSRKTIISKALESAVFVQVKDREQALEVSNWYAPEHLIIQTENADRFIPEITNAGSVFLGGYTPESLGDYASGTNHTLPTGGYAKSYSGVSLDSFIKKITFQKAQQEGLKIIAPTVIEMAKAEQLDAHQRAVEIRMENLLQQDKS